MAVGAHVEIVMGLMVEHQLGPSFLQAEVNNGIRHVSYRKHTGHGSNANVENLVCIGLFISAMLLFFNRSMVNDKR